MAISGLPAQADPLIFDNFTGPVANANGQFPTIGSSPWGCTGPGAADCIRGGGKLTSATGANTIYYFLKAPTTPLQFTYRFTDNVEAPTFVIASTRNGQLDNMWHANGFNSGPNFAFRQSIWCNTDVGCAAGQADLSPASGGMSIGACPVTTANHPYIGSLRIYGDTAIATLQDAVTGTLLCSNVASDPKLQSLIGPSFFLESYSQAPHVAFTSVEADASPTRALSSLTQSSSTNVRAVAAAIDVASFTSGSFGPLYNVPAAQVPGALAQLSGEIAAVSGGSAAATSTAFIDLLFRLSAHDQALPSPTNMSLRKGRGTEKFSVWAGGYGAEHNYKADPTRGAHEGNGRQEGAAVGFEYLPANSWLIGGAVGQAHTNWKLQDIASNSDADSTQAGLYLSKVGGRAYFDIGLGYSHFSFSTERFVTLGSTSRYAGKFDAINAEARAELGWRIWRNASTNLTAFVRVDGQRFSAPSYDETTTGDPAYALAVSTSDRDELFHDTGLKMSARALGNLILIEGSVAYRRVYWPARSAHVGFSGTPGAIFEVSGPSTDRDLGMASLGAAARLTDHLSLSAGLVGTIGSNTSIYSGSVTLRQAL